MLQMPVFKRRKIFRSNNNDKISMTCMQWMKDGQCCSYHFARAKPLQLHEVIHGCKLRGEDGEQMRYQGISNHIRHFWTSND